MAPNNGGKLLTVSVSFYPSPLVFRRDKWALISDGMFGGTKKKHPKTVGLNLSYAAPNYD